ncbi:hypothetical protein HY382_01815 [Candidatus Curtissbacteria bacterium]|nr:hypothetical protein [Candidatus Curtissbacteria bacterium]
MPAYTSYKNYLALLKEKSKPQYFKKSLNLVLIVTVLALGVVSSLIILTVNIGREAKLKKDFAQTAVNTFTTGKNTLADNLESFQIAGATTKFLDEVKESSQAAQGYQVTISEEDKTIAKAENTILLLESQKRDLEKQTTPADQQKVKETIIEYFNESISALTQIRDEHKFAKDLILTLGADFYLTKLTQDGLWEQQDKTKVINFYNSQTTEVQKTQSKIIMLTPPSNYRSFFKQQIEYLKRVENLSQSIITLLSQEDSKDPDEAKQIEKAYQLLQTAKEESNKLAKNLMTERLSAFEKQDNLAKFAKARILESAIEDQLQSLIQEEEFNAAPIIEAIDKIKNIISVY